MAIGNIIQPGERQSSTTSLTDLGINVTADEINNSVNSLSTDDSGNVTIDGTITATTIEGTLGDTCFSEDEPLPNGTASAGTSSEATRCDHVHPPQTSVTGSSGSCTGNAATATKLETARTINGVSFDGSANITIPVSAVTASSTNGNIKIDGAETTVYTHPTTAGNKHIPSGGSSGKYLGYSSSGTAVWTDKPSYTASEVGAATSSQGSKADTAIQSIKIGTVSTGSAGSSASVTASTSGTTSTLNFTIPMGATGATGPTGATGADGATGATGTRGSVWTSGTAMSGTSTTTGAYSYSAASGALVGDYYLNSSTGGIYRCTTAGSGTTAKWTYQGSIKGATGDTGATGATGPAGSDATVTYYTSTPNANGTASAGSSSSVSRGDHVHPLQTSVSGSSGSCTGNAATATKTYVTDTNPSSGTVYYVPFTATDTGNASLLTNNGIVLGVKQGTTSSDGFDQLTLGNSTATGTAGNKTGSIRLYSTGAYYWNISGDKNDTAHRILKLPKSSGCLTCVPTDGTAVGSSTTPVYFNGSGVATACSLTSSSVGLGSVGNFKAVSTVASQGLTTAEQSNARTNIGAAASSDLSNYLPLSGNAATATKLQTARTINGVSFDGSANITLPAQTSVTGSSGSCTGNSATATQVYSTTTDPTSLSTYPIPFHTTASSGNKDLKNNDGVRYSTQQGTTSTNGTAQLLLGNSTASGTAGNKTGSMRLYDTSSNYWEISGSKTSGANRTLKLPKSSGCLTCVPTDGTAVGSSTTPTYVSTSGVVTACSKTLDDNLIRCCHVYSSSSSVASYGWYKMMSITNTLTHQDYYAKILVSTGVSTGILELQVRSGSTKGKLESQTIKWLIKDQGINANNFVLCSLPTSGTSVVSELWVRLSAQYSGYNLRVLDECKRETGDNTTYWQLYDYYNSGYGESSYPTSGYTVLQSTYSGIPHMTKILSGSVSLTAGSKTTLSLSESGSNYDWLLVVISGGQQGVAVLSNVTGVSCTCPISGSTTNTASSNYLSSVVMNINASNSTKLDVTPCTYSVKVASSISSASSGSPYISEVYGVKFK